MPTKPPRLATSAALGVVGIVLLLGAASTLSASVPTRWMRPEQPSLADLPQGPVLQRAVQRGVLVVGVRSYPRPAPPGTSAPAEPDSYDAAIAGRVAAQLGLRVALVGLAPSAQDQALHEGRVDLVLAGAPAAPAARGIAAAQGSYDQAAGMLVALRKGRVQQASDLRDASVCVAQGSGHASTVAERYGARPRSYPSSVHAASAFMAGECQVLAEDSRVVERLLRNEEWRFYKVLAHGLVPQAEAAIRLAEGDAASRDFLSAALRQWRADGTLEQARTARAGNLQFEIGLLKDGLVCHS